MKNRLWKITSILFAAALMAAPVSASQTETETESSEAGILNDVSTELEDGILTIRIQSNEEAIIPGYYWESYKGDKGDASCVELLTESDMEEGLAYAGSFRAIDDGDDTIRLVHTNGHCVREYLDYNVTAKDEKITEITGGSQAFPTSGEDLAPFLEGNWSEEDGAHLMDVALTDDGGLLFIISTDHADDPLYSMTAYYDCILDALVYWDGVEYNLQDADSTQETEKDAEDAGTGLFAIETLSEDPEDDSIGILWKDDTFQNTEVGMFVRP